MQEIGITGFALSLFDSYLKNRLIDKNKLLYLK